MQYKILGTPCKQDEFKISPNYRGICRNEIPESRFKEQQIENKLHNLINDYFESTSTTSFKALLDIAVNMSELATEKFELVLFSKQDEELPESVEYSFLGFEVLSTNERSMIHFWLRKMSSNNSDIYKKHQMY